MKIIEFLVIIITKDIARDFCSMANDSEKLAILDEFLDF